MDAPEVRTFQRKDWVWFCNGLDMIFGRIAAVQQVSKIGVGSWGRMSYVSDPGNFRYRVLDVLKEGDDVDAKTIGYWRNHSELLLAKDEEVCLYMLMR